MSPTVRVWEVAGLWLWSCDCGRPELERFGVECGPYGSEAEARAALERHAGESPWH
jgi:hypothetical protein